MQDIENNMDDLLRKAAENYPLKAGDGDWDAVAARLNPQPAPPRRRGNALKFGLAFLFLFTFLFTGDYVLKQPAGVGNGSVANGHSGTTAQPPVLKHEHPVLKYEQPNRDAGFEAPNKKESPDQEQNNIIHTLPRAAGTANTITEFNGKPALDIAHADTVAEAVNFPSINPEKESRQRKPRLYLGVVFGPEFNQVKGQRFEKTGFDAGVVIGYRLKDRLSIETGLLLSKKYYYSDARYFNMDMPGMKLLSLEGSCTVLEIPVRLRYEVLDKNNSKLYGSAGLSTYLLRKEENNYLALVNGTEQTMVNSYKEPCRYFAATVDLGIIYEHQLRTNTSLRIEPYLQLPMRGIGVGTMPVRSAGLHVGLIRSIQ